MRYDDSRAWIPLGLVAGAAVVSAPLFPLALRRETGMVAPALAVPAGGFLGLLAGIGCDLRGLPCPRRLRGLGLAAGFVLAALLIFLLAWGFPPAAPPLYPESFTAWPACSEPSDGSCPCPDAAAQ